MPLKSLIDIRLILIRKPVVCICCLFTYKFYEFSSQLLIAYAIIFAQRVSVASRATAKCDKKSVSSAAHHTVVIISNSNVYFL